jgi:hypothetical protein
MGSAPVVENQMANRYESVAVFMYPFDAGSAGCVRFGGKELITGVTGVSWVGGELRAATKDGDKRVRFDKGTVHVEDVASDAGRQVSTDELSVAVRQVQAYFGAQPDETPELSRDEETYLARG